MRADWFALGFVMLLTALGMFTLVRNAGGCEQVHHRLEAS